MGCLKTSGGWGAIHPFSNPSVMKKWWGEEYAGKAKVAKVDIESDEATKQLAMTQGVTSIPALMVFKGGEKVASEVGAQGKPKLAELIDNALA